jgi:asparagine synthase (glutamine-hydrolysing)
MRRAMEGFLPPTILNKKKVGLEMPYSRWFKDELKDLMMAYLGPQRISDVGLFRPEVVGALIDEHLTGRADHGRALWGLLNYVMWYDLYIGSGSTLADEGQYRPVTPEMAYSQGRLA